MNFIITEMSSAFIARDPAGRRTKYDSRAFAGFIITKSGKIKFSYDGGEVISDAKHSVFLPEGLSYVNECIEDAESYVFNFHMLGTHEPMSLKCESAVPAARLCYESVLPKTFFPSLRNSLGIMESLYTLAYALFCSESASEAENPIVGRAIGFMRRNMANVGLTVRDVARDCNMSEIYLRKLFGKHLSITPFKKLTEIRMEHARLLIKEKRALKEVASAVGYSDVFQFSRAYKRCFGHSPTKS